MTFAVTENGEAMPVPKNSKLPYTEVQWQWVAARYREGYTQKMLAEFMCVSSFTIQHRLQKMGVIPYRREELDPLESRKQEFMELAD